MKVRANRVVSYGGKEHAPGEEFDMKDKEANAFLHSKRVSTVEEKPQAKAVKPEATEAPPPVDKGTKKPKKGKHDADTGDDDAIADKGRYKRRDVRAEDESTREGED